MKSTKSNIKSSNKPMTGRLIFAALIVVFLGGVLYASYNLISTEVDYTSAREEYAELRRIAPQFTAIMADPADDEDDSDDTPQPEPTPDLTAINPDYIGWIRIDGTDIDYPIVQGHNNEWYMNRTFMGERNPSGTIFMDSNVKGGFSNFAFLHGHNMRDGSMFAGLHNFLDVMFLSDHRYITIITPEGKELNYFIFDTKVTDINDEIFDMPKLGSNALTFYFTAFGFTEEDFQSGIDILTLATCTNNHRDERLLVFAFRHKN